jgi:rfaE bifunctional protein kinase chain/domain
MTLDQFRSITSKYPRLRIAVIGDFCLDRYMEIDPFRSEISIETGLTVHNVINVRSQPGGAGTVAGNLSALGIGTIYPVGFHGTDGEGFELRRALGALPGVRLDHFFETSDRRTFTYCKPLVLEPEGPPRELSRLDTKNWTPTPKHVTGLIMGAIRELRTKVDIVIALEQVDVPETGVITSTVRDALEVFAPVPVIADSRRGLADYPPVILKMNMTEFRRFSPVDHGAAPHEICQSLAPLADRQGRRIFVTLAENGIIGADPGGQSFHYPALPSRGPIDVVGAGDAVTASLAASIAAGADLSNTLQLAMLASSIVVHKLGTTGIASLDEIGALIENAEDLLPNN